MDDIKREIKQEKPLAVEPVPVPVPSDDLLRSAQHPLEVSAEKDRCADKSLCGTL